MTPSYVLVTWFIQDHSHVSPLDKFHYRFGIDSFVGIYSDLLLMARDQIIWKCMQWRFVVAEEWTKYWQENFPEISVKTPCHLSDKATSYLRATCYVLRATCYVLCATY